MFSGDISLQRQEDGCYFIDRNPQVFAMVLDFLRNNCRIPVIKDEYLKESFDMELAYWNL